MTSTRRCRSTSTGSAWPCGTVRTCQRSGFGCSTSKPAPARLQLLQPLGPGPAEDNLRRHGEGPDHICYTVDDIPAALAVLAPGVEVPIFMGGRGRRACFLPERQHGLRIELTEREPFGAT